MPPDTSFLVNGFKPTIAAADPRDVMAFKQQQAAGAQQLQSGALDLQQKQLQLEDEQKMRQAWQDANGDPDKMFAIAAKNGVGPKTMMSTQQSITAMKEAKAKLSNQELQNHELQNDQLHALMEPVLAETDPAKQAALWDQQMKAGVQGGALTAAEMAAHPYPGNPEGVKQYATTLNTDKWLTAQAASDRAAAAAKAAATGASRQDIEAPGQQAAAELLARKNAAAVLAGATDQNDYAAKRGALPPKLATQFPNAFDPATSPASINRIGMSPEEKAADDRAGVTAKQTADRDKNTAENERLGRDQREKQIKVEQARVTLEQKKFDATFGQGLDANGRALSPEDRKNAALSDPTAVATANYQIPPPSTRGSAVGKAIYDKVLAIDPAYDGTKFAERNKIAQDFSASGTSGKAITSADTALAHLNTISVAGKALKSGDVTQLNRLATFVGAQTGNAAPAVYDSIVATVAPEISKAVIGGPGGQEDRAKMAANFSRNLSDEQREGAIGANAGLLGARVDKMTHAYEADMGKPFARKLSPESQAVRDRYSGGGVAPIALKDGTSLTPHSQAQADAFRKDHPELIK